MLERIDRARNISRFYVLSIEPTLFEDLALVRRWGRVGSAGRERSTYTRLGGSRRSNSRNGSIARSAADTSSGPDGRRSASECRLVPRWQRDPCGPLKLLSPPWHAIMFLSVTGFTAQLSTSEEGIRREPECRAVWPIHDPVLPFPLIARRQIPAQSGPSRLDRRQTALLGRRVLGVHWPSSKCGRLALALENSSPWSAGFRSAS